MPQIYNDEILNVAVEASLAASNSIMEAVSLPRVSNFKGKTDLVTKTDIESERIIKSIIRSSFKDHSILAEETDNELTDSDYLWIIDPLDGTTNFVHGYPSFAVSIGVYWKNKPLVGTVLEMPNLKLYTAIKGEGAFCEGEKIDTSDTKKLDVSLLVTGFGYDHGNNWNTNMELFKHFTDITQGVRRLRAASVDICHVACGKVDGFWEYDLKPWDTAAGILIAQESGCMITDIRGNDFRLESDNILITNRYIHDEFLEQAIAYLN